MNEGGQQLTQLRQLDIVSPSRYFGVTIPRLALSNRALYYACLTCASRVLIRQGTLDKTKCDEYEDTAISAFIPQLSNLGDTQQRETLPAIATILRMAEQFYEIQEDARCHLSGAPSLFTGKPDSFGHGSAAFWLYLRQSIRAAFLNEEPCKLDPTLVPVDFNPVSEAAWSNRVAVLLSRTCSACWDPSLESTQQQAQLDELRLLLDLWRQNVPETFLPWCNYRAENESFPVIQYVSPWHGRCLFPFGNFFTDSKFSGRLAILLCRKSSCWLTSSSRKCEPDRHEPLYGGRF